MKRFSDFITEEVVPAALVQNGSIDIDKEEVRASINMALAKVTADGVVTPYIALNRIQKALAYFHIILPKKVYLDGAKGVEVHELRQFGHKMGMTNDGEFVHEVPGKYFLFMQYAMNTPMVHGAQKAWPTMGGTFRVMAKVVDQVELDRLVSMAELALAEDYMDAEAQQMKAKVAAPHETMKDVTSDEKKKGNKAAVAVSQKGLDEDKDPCWKGYEMIGMKKKGARKVPNCVPVKEEVESTGKKYNDNSHDVKDWSPQQLKWHRDKLTTSSAKAHSELKRRAKVGEPVKEEVEKIDEIKVSTAYSYAGKKMEKERKGLLPGDHNPTSKTELKNMRNAAERTDKDYYKKRGFKKIEEEQIDELDQKTMLSYKSAAKDDRRVSKAIIKKGSDTEGRWKHAAKKRKIGLKLVKKRLGEEQIDEITKKTYVKTDPKDYRSSDPFVRHRRATGPGDYRSSDPFVRHRRAKDLEGIDKSHYPRAGRTNGMKEETQIDEKAPPGAKFERMVKHMKRESKD